MLPSILSTLGFSPSRRVLSLVFHEPSLPWPRSKVLFFLSFFYVLSSMADDVADGLGNMKLTSDEEEIIPISDEGRMQAM